jgi:hypothetical protein
VDPVHRPLVVLPRLAAHEEGTAGHGAKRHRAGG